MRNTRQWGIAISIVAGIALMFGSVGYAIGTGAHKVKLPRDDVYYEITNDAGDYGNYIETYHIPVPDTDRKVFCIVYSDKIGKGGGAGPSCDWVGFWRNH